MNDDRADLRSRDDVERLVRSFYRDAAMDDRLGPIFAAARVDWPSHIDRLDGLLVLAAARREQLHRQPPAAPTFPPTAARHSPTPTSSVGWNSSPPPSTTSSADRPRRWPRPEGSRWPAALSRLLAGSHDHAATPVPTSIALTSSRVR